MVEEKRKGAVQKVDKGQPYIILEKFNTIGE
jgi:hypothetical protein